MPFAIILFLAALFPFPVFSQSLEIKFDEIEPGSYVVVNRNDGKRFTYLFLGKKAGKYRVTMFEGKSTSGKEVATYTFNSDSEIISGENPKGEIVEYSPHACIRTVGKCHYTITMPDGSREKRMLITEVTDDGFKSQEFSADGTLRETSSTVLDRFGWAKSREIRRKGQGVRKLKQIKAVYK